MREDGIGRVLVASLHQAIADILPTRLGFYENWLNAEGLREGTIGLAPLSRSAAPPFRVKYSTLFRHDARSVTEFIIQSKTNNVGRQVVEIICKVCEVAWKSICKSAVGADAIKSDVQVLGFYRPIVSELVFNATADDPTNFCC